MGRHRLAVVHGAIDSINRFLFASHDETEFAAQLRLSGCDGIVAGHCGVPFTRIIDGRLWHNSGAIGMPANDGTNRTWYSLFTPQNEWIEVRHIALTFDHHETAEKMLAAGLPQGYADALRTGLWPNCDVLPPVERENRGRPLKDETIFWAKHVKFTDPDVTVTGAPRAVVPLRRLETLWFNTGTLCNLACDHCYIESSPRNDRLAYLDRAEAKRFMTEAATFHPGTTEIGFTGGEPFMNPDILSMMEDALEFGFRVLVLTNAMKPMQHLKTPLLALHRRYPDRIALRVSIDHYHPDKHEQVRGPGSLLPAIDGLLWLVENGFEVSVAGRTSWSESEAELREGYGRLFSALGLAIDAMDTTHLILFPEMDEGAEIPEISESCWTILGKSPDSVMCASSRMVVHRKGAQAATIVACTLLPYDQRFELGPTLADASKPVSLNHRHCAKFCVLGGASCSPHHA